MKRNQKAAMTGKMKQGQKRSKVDYCWDPFPALHSLSDTVPAVNDGRALYSLLPTCTQRCAHCEAKTGVSIMRQVTREISEFWQNAQNIMYMFMMLHFTSHIKGFFYALSVRLVDEPDGAKGRKQFSAKGRLGPVPGPSGSFIIFGPCTF